MKSHCTRRHPAALTVALVLGALALMPSARAQISGQAFAPIVWGSSSNASFVEYSTSVAGGNGDQFLNVVRSDGTWVVQNLPVGFEGASSIVSTNVDSSLFVSGASYSTSQSSTPAVVAPTFGTGTTASLNLSAPVNYLANDPEGKGAAFGAFTNPGTPSVLGLTFAPNFNFVYHTGVPDLAQGVNECAPTSAANSLTWLKNTYSLTLAQTTAQIRDTLKDANHMQTSAATGTTDANFLAGKNKYVQENNLPIITHLVTGGAALAGRPAGLGTAPSGANLSAELAKGQDVELSLIWGNGGGHWVTLVGVINVGNTTGIWFNDPDDGKTKTNFSWLDNLAGGAYSIRSYGVANGGNTVDTAFAESVAPEPSGVLVVLLGGGVLALTAARRRRA